MGPMHNLRGYRNGRIQFWSDNELANVGYALMVVAGEMVRRGIYLKVMSQDPLGMVSYLVLDTRPQEEKDMVSADLVIYAEARSFLGSKTLRSRLV